MEIINVMATSLDGKIAGAPLQNDAGRMRIGFGSEEDHELVRAEIRNADAIITGANSVRAMGCVWDVAHQSGKFPHWLIVSNAGLVSSLKFWQQTHIPRSFLTESNQTPAAISATVQNLNTVTYQDHHPATIAAEWLRARGFQRVLLFGGGKINRLFYEKNLVNELKITICPIMIGNAAAPQLLEPPLTSPVQFSLISSQISHNHLFLNYRVLHQNY